MIFFTGFLIGVVSLIPGISGGTILVLTKKYNEITNAISHYRKKENLKILLFLVCGIILGTITFARIIEFLFYFFPNGTMIVFSSFILFHLPTFLQEEVKKPKWKWFFLGIALIFLLSFFATDIDKVVINYPKINLGFLIYFTFCGAIDGFFTILPGISGSMIMMLLGPYFLYKSFLANLSFSSLYLLLPLACYFMGDLFGFFIGSKFSLYFIEKHQTVFFSIILGMIFMSAFILLPIPIVTIPEILHYVFFFTLGYILYKIIHSFT